MILCFSGTGNSRYIAKKIAVELQDEIVDVNAVSYTHLTLPTILLV